MENNQQERSVRNTAGSEYVSFDNQQPGQQLPENNMDHKSNQTTDASKTNEQHSESSLPENENETLGTP